MSTPEVPDDPGNGLTEIEKALGSLAPAPSRLDRDRVMFRAGRAAARPRPAARWAWPALAASLAAVALGEGALLARRPAERIVERVVYVPAPPVPAVAPPTPGPVESPAVAHEIPEGPAPIMILVQNSPATRRAAPIPPAPATPYARLLRDMLRYGVDALPEPPPLAMQPTGAGPEPSRRLLRAEIESLLNPGESS